MTRDRLHLIDGTFELFRAHYSRRPSRTSPDGTPVKATVGLAASLLALLNDDEEACSHVAIAFDNPIESFRNDLYAGYKTGEGVDPELAAQFDLAEEAAACLGIVVWSMAEHEADDALATGAARWRDRVDQVRLLSPDKDLGQCLRDDRVVLVDRIRRRVIDERAFREQRGIDPASVPDYLALVGDRADGIPGLRGFGKKTAATLLARYRHLDAIPDDASDWQVKVRGAERLAETLRSERDEALLYRRLATLVEDVPLAQSLGELKWLGVPRQAFTAWCERMGAGYLLERPARWRTGV